MADMAPPTKLPSTSSDKYKDTFLHTTEFNPLGFYEPTYFLFAHQALDGIPIHLFPGYMERQTARLWRPPLNPVERLTDPLKKVLSIIKETYELTDKADRIPGHAIEKRYLQHTLWHNQLLWIDLDDRLATYAKDKLGPAATVRDIIDAWDHPSTAWVEHFSNFFDNALGFQILNGMVAWEFGDTMLDLIDTGKMLLADVKEWVYVDETAQRGASSTKGLLNEGPTQGVGCTPTVAARASCTYTLLPFNLSMKSEDKKKGRKVRGGPPVVIPAVQ